MNDKNDDRFILSNKNILRKTYGDLSEALSDSQLLASEVVGSSLLRDTLRSGAQIGYQMVRDEATQVATNGYVHFKNKLLPELLHATSNRLFGQSDSGIKYEEKKSSEEPRNIPEEAKHAMNETARTVYNNATNVATEGVKHAMTEGAQSTATTLGGRGSFSRVVMDAFGIHTAKGARWLQVAAADFASNALGIRLPPNSTVADSIGLMGDGRQAGLFKRIMPDHRVNVMNEINSGIQATGDRGHNVNNIKNTVGDLDGDGDVDKKDVAISQSGMDLVNELRLLHPLIARAHRDPKFMQRTIK